MATFTVKFDTDNAAFGEHDLDTLDRRTEIARILRVIADHVDGGLYIMTYQTILDANGNDVGRFALKPGKYILQEVPA